MGSAPVPPRSPGRRPAALLLPTGGGTSCVVPGATVELLAPDAGAPSARVVRTGRTDADGRMEFRVRPPRSLVHQARTPDAQSAPTTFEVGTRLSLVGSRSGTAVVAQTVLSTGSGRSVSQRVALTVG